MKGHYSIIFDGGCKGNCRQGYGSYIIFPDKRIGRLDFGYRSTNNEAEYKSLLGALSDLVQTLAEKGEDPQHYSLTIRGDSRLIINQVLGEWRVLEPRLRPLCDQARLLLKQFAHYQLRWWPRAESEKTLGH